MSHLNDREIGWLAGIIDGEGCISMYETTKEKLVVLSLTVQMTCKETVHRVKRLAATGNLSFREEPNKNKNKWTWRANGKEAIFVLKLIQSDLFTKRAQMLIALEFGTKCFAVKGKLTEHQRELAFRLMVQLQSLNAKGKY
jgi:hypothetical protein